MGTQDPKKQNLWAPSAAR